jgi:hypothetical protein
MSVTLRFIDWIWHVRGSVALAPQHTGGEAFACLAPLFDQPGTSHARADDTLTFRKKDAAAQDGMSIFERGVLRVEYGAGGAVLHYHLISRALLYCFLAPLAFLAFAQGLIAYDAHHKSPAHAAVKAPKKAEKPPVVLPQNPIDKALGAPAPEKAKKEGEDGQGEGARKHSPTPAYVFACLFAVLYVAGRILEDRLVKRLFTRALLSEAAPQTSREKEPEAGQNLQLARL